MISIKRRITAVTGWRRWLLALLLGATAAATFALHVGNGNGALDTSSIIKLIQGKG